MNMKREAASMFRYISRLFVRKIFNRFFAALVASVLLVNSTIDSFAAVPVATGADWITATVSDADGFSNPDLQLAREMRERYEKSFIYCPMTLEQRLNQRIAFVDDLLVILALLLSACGIYLASNDAIKDLFTSFESWFRMSYGDDAAAMGVWETILIGNLGMTIVGMAKFLPILQDFLGLELTGYGTGTTDFEISGIGAVGVSLDGPIMGLSSVTAWSKDYNYFSTGYYGRYGFDTIYDCFSIASYGDPLAILVGGGFFDFYYKYDGVIFHSKAILYNKDGFVYTPQYYYNTAEELAFMSGTMPVPVFTTEEEILHFLDVGFGVISIPADNVWTDLQQDAAVRYGDVLTIPQTVEAWEALKAQLTEATTSKDAIDALAPAISLEIIEGTKPEDKPNDKLFPWLPDITSPLTGITDALTGIKEWIITIPETLVNLKDAIIAIPGQITDFFTLDMVVVSGAFVSLQDTFTARFGGITQLGTVFKRSYSLDMVIPVFSVKVPPELSQLFPDKSEIVIMDLRPYKDYFLWGRGLLVAMFWIAFAKWLLDQFDVKLGVG